MAKLSILATPKKVTFVAEPSIPKKEVKNHTTPPPAQAGKTQVKFN